MNINRKISTVGIFLGAILILVFYLLSVRNGLNIPPPIYFIAIAIIVGIVVYQILGIELSPGFIGILLLEITITALVFHLIYQIPSYTIYGSDTYFDLASLKAIILSGRINGIPEYTQITSFFPMIHILGAQFALITGMEALSVAKWFPSLVGTIVVPLIYLLVKFLFKKEKAALLAALLFASIQHYILFGSLFIRETIALVLALTCVYLYISAKSSRHPVAYRSLAILCLIGTIVAHHLTSVMLIVFFLVYWIFSVIYQRLSARRNTFNKTTESISLSFIIIGIVGTLTYWLFFVTQPVQIFVAFMNDILSLNIGGSRTILGTMGGLPNLRYYFLIYGSYICYIVFGIILLYKSFFRKASQRLEVSVFTIYLAMCAVVAFMSYYLLPPTISGDRFLAYGWLFAFGPLALAIIEFRNKFAYSASLGLAVFFILLNLYTIHPTIWDVNAKGAGGSAQEEDIALAHAITFGQENYLGYMTDLMAVYEEQNKLGVDPYSALDPVNIENYDLIIINRKSFTEEAMYSGYARDTILEMESLDANGSIQFYRIYDSPNLSVLRRR